MACSKKHRYLPQWENLPVAQDDVKGDRHKCPGCAYEAGLKDALTGNPHSKTLPADIPDSQAGTGRHKDAYQAYTEGYNYGLEIKS
ncbi:MAG: hypothetical protein LBK62_10780 [Treponema sp.]|jgi:hypothetical protein|nr:hypothetical protein [Treponema sp.]